MKKNRTYRKIGLLSLKTVVAVLIGILVLCASAVFAGRGDKVGTASAIELLIPVGARTIGMGNSNLSLVSGIEAMYWNPAGIMRSQMNTSVMFSHMAYLADIGVDYVALNTSLNDVGRLGLSVKSLSFGEVNVTTEDQPDGTGETTSPTFLVIGGTFARNISDRIAIGITSNFVYEKMANVSASGIAFTAGVQYTGLGGIDGLGVGVVIRNIGPALKFNGTGLLRTAEVNDALRGGSALAIASASADLPSTIEIGLGYTVNIGQEGFLHLTSTFQNNNFADDEYKIGAEYILRNTIFIRGGYAFAPSEGQREYIYGASAGIGVRTMLGANQVSVDYAYRSVKYFNGNSVFTIGIEF